MTNASSYTHPDDPDALNDEGIALDVAETIHAGKDGGPGAFWLPEHGEALERLARWANAHGYQNASRDQHERLERGESLSRPITPAGVDHAERVYIVERQTGDGDGIYAFIAEDQAEEYANRYPGAVVHTEFLMNGSAGAQFLIDTHEEDPELTEGDREDVEERLVGKIVRDRDGRIWEVTEIDEKDDMLTIAGSKYWQYIDSGETYLDLSHIAAARSWVASQFHHPDQVERLSDAEIVSHVDQHYPANSPGQDGWSSFNEDQAPDELDVARSRR